MLPTKPDDSFATAKHPTQPEKAPAAPSKEPGLIREHLVVDAGAFIRLKQLHRFGYSKVHTVTGVLAEIRDKKAREHLNLNLITPNVMAPTERDVAFVRRFAKATGDLGFLSDTDIDVIALTYMLQRLTGDVQHLRAVPLPVHTVQPDAGGTLIERRGGTFQWSVNRAEEVTADSNVTSKQDAQFDAPASTEPLANKMTDNADKNLEYDHDHPPNESQNARDISGSNEAESESENLDEFSDENDWIGENNLQEFLESENTVVEADSDPARLRVACLSTDYSVQNVLIQMGISVLSIDGMRIREAKRWALFCRGCRKVTQDTTRQFCPMCGNSCVQRVPFVVSVDGTAVAHYVPRNRRVRGLVYSLPKPKGGRQGDLILCEDQLYIGGRDRTLRHEKKKWEKEKLARNPFNPDIAYEQQGWWSRQVERPFKPIQIGFGPGNPNSNRWQKHRSRR